MTKRDLLTLCGLLGALAIVAWAFMALLIPFLSNSRETREGPEVAFFGTTWDSVILEGEGDHNTYAIWTHLIAPKGFDIKTLAEDGDLIVNACKAIVAQQDAFIPQDVAFEGLDHIDINFKFGSEAFLPFDLTIYVVDGKCVNRGSAEALAARSGTVSKHGINEELAAIVHSWGLKPLQTSFGTTNGKKVVKIQYQVLGDIGRSIKSIVPGYQCVLSLGMMHDQAKMLGPLADAKNYTEMEISYMDRSTSGFGVFHYSRGLGGARFAIKDGICTQPEATNG